MANAMNKSSDNDPACCFREWMNLQEEDLSELLQALHSEAKQDDQSSSSTTHEDQLHQLIEKSIQHFQDYIQKRASLARENAITYFAPSWCTPLECSAMWIAGCRPASFIRLIYALIGEEIESQLQEYLEDTRRGNLGEASPMQMNLIDNLHRKTIREEDQLSARLASLQEDMADSPISIIAKQASTCRHSQPGKEIDEALEKYARAMMTMMEEADSLRLNTLKELIKILTPVQAVNFLAASTKLHLCLHAWSGVRESSRHSD